MLTVTDSGLIDIDLIGTGLIATELKNRLCSGVTAITARVLSQSRSRYRVIAAALCILLKPVCRQ
jgi:hypothetical protein